MTKIKLCGLKNPRDIEYANELKPDFIGFVFARGSKRFVSFDEAEGLKKNLNKDITSVGVFVNEDICNIEYLVNKNTISMIQLHGDEDNEYINKLRNKTDCPIIQAFRIETKQDVARAKKSKADYIMLDSVGGTGEAFNHLLIGKIKREFFLAGGLSSENVCEAISKYAPYAVDASSSLETNGLKDKNKMTAFVNAVRNGGK